MKPDFVASSTKYLLHALTLGLCLVTSARAVVVDVNSRVHSEASPLEIFLEAGAYSVEPIGVGDGGAFDAWSAWSFTTCPNPDGCVRTSPTTFTGWLNAYNVISPDITAVSVEGVPLTPVVVPTTSTFFLVTSTLTQYRVDDGLVYPSASSALATAQSSTFTLSAAGIVGFAIQDGPGLLRDNRGGVSLSVLPKDGAVPEPPTLVLLGLALVGLRYFRRATPRRRWTAEKKPFVEETIPKNRQ